MRAALTPNPTFKVNGGAFAKVVVHSVNTPAFAKLQKCLCSS